jgi:hypothetical protein
MMNEQQARENVPHALCLGQGTTETDSTPISPGVILRGQAVSEVRRRANESKVQLCLAGDSVLASGKQHGESHRRPPDEEILHNTIREFF